MLNFTDLSKNTCNANSSQNTQGFLSCNFIEQQNSFEPSEQIMIQKNIS